jgi:excisionase family DNA binding protein
MDNREYVKALKQYSMSLNVKEAAEIMRVSTKLVYRMIREGVLLSVRIGREIRIPKTELIAYIRGNR